jgi:hypothetical protein
MDKRKRTKEQTTIYKTLHRKLKIGSCCSTCYTRRVTAIRHEHHMIWEGNMLDTNTNKQIQIT